MNMRVSQMVRDANLKVIQITIDFRMNLKKLNPGTEMPNLCLAKVTSAIGRD
jgi:hypothetical protein